MQELIEYMTFAWNYLWTKGGITLLLIFVAVYAGFALKKRGWVELKLSIVRNLAFLDDNKIIMLQ